MPDGPATLRIDRGPRLRSARLQAWMRLEAATSWATRMGWPPSSEIVVERLLDRWLRAMRAEIRESANATSRRDADGKKPRAGRSERAQSPAQGPPEDHAVGRRLGTGRAEDRARDCDRPGNGPVPYAMDAQHPRAGLALDLPDGGTPA